MFFPIFNHIFRYNCRNTKTKKINVFHYEKEEILLIQFLQYFNKHHFQQVIGYNISYDVRFIFSRCLKYNLAAPAFFKSKKVDLMRILKSVNGGYDFNKPGTLDQWCQYLFNKSKTYNNIEIPSLYELGRIDDILSYNKNDLKLTYNLWKRITSVLL